MISLIVAYIKKVANTHWRVAFGWEFIVGLSLAISLLFVSYSKKHAFPDELQIVASRLEETLGTFSTVMFGTTFGALILAARFSGLNMSVNYMMEENGDYFEHFFRLSWIALVDLFAMLLSKFAVPIIPKDLVFPNAQNSLPNNALCSLLLFLFCYCLLTSFSVLLSVSTLCVFYTETKETEDLLNCVKTNSRRDGERLSIVK